MLCFTLCTFLIPIGTYSYSYSPSCNLCKITVPVKASICCMLTSLAPWNRIMCVHAILWKEGIIWVDKNCPNYWEQNLRATPHCQLVHTFIYWLQTRKHIEYTVLKLVHNTIYNDCEDCPICNSCSLRPLTAPKLESTKTKQQRYSTNNLPN